jgi:multiple sugar transport system ATP-binding protein
LVLGIRPEHFEDAALVEDHQRAHGVEFTAPVDLVESMGSDKYVYFTIEGGAATAADLEDLAADAGGDDLPGGAANLVTRLSAESRVKEGRDAKVWLNLEKIHLFDPSDGRNITLEA